MKPVFTSWSAFFYMGGYGYYVWGAVLITLISFIVFAFYLKWKHLKLVKSIEKQMINNKNVMSFYDNTQNDESIN